MSRIFITGDIHGEHDIQKLSSKAFREGKTLTKQDYLIIAGDFGLVFDQVASKSEQYWLQWLTDKPWTTLFIDGNHENFVRLFSDEFSERPMFSDTVKQITPSVFYLQRGRVYIIGDRTFFTMGGAPSIDKHQRVPYLSWWPQEEPSHAEWSNAIEKARSVGSVDYLVTHDTLPAIYNEMHRQNMLAYKQRSPVSEGLWALDRHLQYKQAFSGHMHIDKEFADYRWRILYKDIVEVT